MKYYLLKTQLIVLCQGYPAKSTWLIEIVSIFLSLKGAVCRLIIASSQFPHIRVLS